MKPDISAVLSDITTRLVAEIAPNVQPAYLASSLGLSAGLLSAINEEFERAAHRRVEENAAIRKLFAEAGGLQLPMDLAARLTSLAARPDTDLRVSALDSTNAELRGALIELQTALEALEGPEAKALDTAIWAELAASTQRRKLAAGNF
ncbi:MAG TPA: hypothetical protein VGI79_16370 [Caulobacteraceae bacterium]|jgi:hypothetical protein